MKKRGWSAFIKKSYQKMKMLGIGLDKVNVVRFHSREPLKHRMAKLVVCHHLFDIGHFFKTEQKIRESFCDVIDLNTFTIYEIEAYATKRIEKKKLEQFYHPLIEDIVIINLMKMDFEWYEMVKFSDEIKKRIRIDGLT